MTSISGATPAASTLVKRVLIADDDGAVTAAITERFKACRIEVDVAHDAMHALFLAYKNPPSVMIIDVWMPAGNGLAVCEMIRSDDRLKETPLLVITGDSEEATRARVESLGAEFIQKTGELWAAIRERCEAIFNVPLVPSE